jgi:hypothetical protein
MSEDLGITTGGDALGHVLALGTNSGGAFTPDGIAAAVEKVAVQIRIVDNELHDLVAAQEVDTAFVNDWATFVLGWYDWRTAHSSWLSDAWNQTRDDLVNWVSQYEDLRQRWVALFPASKAQAFTIQQAAPSTIESWGLQIGAALKHIGIGAAVIVGVAAAGYVLWRVAK